MKNLSNDAKKCIIISAVIFMLLVVAGAFLHMRSIKKAQEEFNQINKELDGRLEGATKQVYRAITDISQGQVITAELIQLEPEALTDTVQELLFSSEDIGKQATVGIHAGEDIHKGMVGEVLEKEWQETELNCVWLSTNLKQYDYVDIRVLFPNGTDYIVAAKKSLQKVRLSSNNAFFWFTEDEILNVDSAIVDANLHGAKIYTTKYVDPALEKAKEVTYQPSDAVVDLLNSDPNVLAEAKENLSKSARAEMEDRLRQFKEDLTEQQKKELEEGFDFHLDTTTNAGTGEASENNNGSQAEEEPTDKPLDSASEDADRDAIGGE